MNRRQFNTGLAALAAVPAFPSFAQAERPIRIIVGFPAGGSADTIARLVADQLRQELGRPVIVESRTGASGRLAPEYVKQAAPDGDTLLLVPHGPMALFPHIYANLRFDPVKDFTPVARLVSYDYALYAANSVPARNVADLKRWLATAKTNATYASPGAGSVPHFVGVSIAQAIQVPMVHIPYRGGAPALADVAGGVVPFAITTLADGAPLVAANRLKVLATSGAKRTEFLDHTPTFKEFGMDVELTGWFAMYAPAGLPAALLDKLNQACARAVLAAPLAKRWAGLGLRADPSSPNELGRIQQHELALWKTVVASSGFTPEN